MKIAVLGIVAALLFATPAMADISPEEMFQDAFQNLMDTVSGEIENLEGGELEKDGKKALKGLQKAAKTAGKLETVGIDKKSLKAAGKIVKTLEKIANDGKGMEEKKLSLLLPAVQSAIEDLIGALQYVADSAGREAAGNQDELGDEKNFDKVGKKIAKAFAKVEGADELWASYYKWAKAWANYVKAVTGYAKASVYAQKLYEKEMKGGGGVEGISFDVDGKIINNSGKPVKLTDLIYDLTFKVPNVPSQNVKLKLSEISPQSLPVDLGTNAFDPTTYSQVWNSLKFIPGISIKGKIIYQTTAGNLTFNFK